MGLYDSPDPRKTLSYGQASGERCAPVSRSCRGKVFSGESRAWMLQCRKAASEQGAGNPLTCRLVFSIPAALNGFSEFPNCAETARNPCATRLNTITMCHNGSSKHLNGVSIGLNDHWEGRNALSTVQNEDLKELNGISKGQNADGIELDGVVGFQGALEVGQNGYSTCVNRDWERLNGMGSVINARKPDLYADSACQNGSPIVPGEHQDDLSDDQMMFVGELGGLSSLHATPGEDHATPAGLPRGFRGTFHNNITPSGFRCGCGCTFYNHITPAGLRTWCEVRRTDMIVERNNKQEMNLKG